MPNILKGSVHTYAQRLGFRSKGSFSKSKQARFRWQSGLERMSMIVVVQLRLLLVQTRLRPMRKKFWPVQKTVTELWVKEFVS